MRSIAQLHGTWGLFLLLTGALLVVGVSGETALSQDADARRIESLAAWEKIASVLQHPRCLNCHQVDRPLQGDARRVHIPTVGRDSKVQGKESGQGAGATKCRN